MFESKAPFIYNVIRSLRDLMNWSNDQITVLPFFYTLKASFHNCVGWRLVIKNGQETSRPVI